VLLLLLRLRRATLSNSTQHNSQPPNRLTSCWCCEAPFSQPASTCRPRMPLLQIRGVCFNVPYPGLIPCVCQPASPTRALRRSRATESRFCAPPPRHHPRSQFFINKSSINNFPMCCQEKQRAQQRAGQPREERARSETTAGQTFSSLLFRTLLLQHTRAAASSWGSS
jgi:hypothetical protein